LGPAAHADDAAVAHGGCTVAGDTEGVSESAGDLTGPSIATAAKPAIYTVAPGDSRDPEALVLTVRPVSLNPDESFLVGVFVADECSPTLETEDYLGTFSYFKDPKIGEPETFTLPAASLAGKLRAWGSGRDLRVELKLIPGHPDGELRDTAIEILDARLVQ
jgi:hypothetical protein